MASFACTGKKEPLTESATRICIPGRGPLTEEAGFAFREPMMPEKTAVGVEDGIATAYEISQLDLTNTELVPQRLRICIGDGGTEGVFGLQRAFKITGVKR